MKKGEFDFKPDIETLISETATVPAMTRVWSSMRREDRDTAPAGYEPIFENLQFGGV